MAVAFAFLAFYFWFFWLRGFLRRSGPDDFNGEVAGNLADHGQQHANAIIKRPTGQSFDQRLGATFGKR